MRPQYIHIEESDDTMFCVSPEPFAEDEDDYIGSADGDYMETFCRNCGELIRLQEVKE